MDKKYLLLLAQKFPTIDSAASEIVNLSAIRSMPKGTEYFFSDIHGEYAKKRIWHDKKQDRPDLRKNSFLGGA